MILRLITKGKHLTIYSWLLLLIALGCGGLAIFSLRYNYQAVSVWFSAVLMGYAIQAFGYAFELASGSLEGARFWLDFVFIGGAFIPSCVLLMALSYQSANSPPRWLQYGLLFTSGGFLLNQWTTQLHQGGLHYYDVSFEHGITIGQMTFGFGYQGYIVYTNLCVLLATLILLSKLWSAPKVFQAQTLSLLLGLGTTWLGFGLFISGFAPMGLDVTLFISGLNALFFAYGIFGHRLFLLTPVARHRLFNALPEPILVLDEHGQLIDFNQEAHHLLPELNPNRLGLPPPIVISDWLKQQNQTQEPVTLRIGQSSYQVVATQLQIHAAAPAQGLILVLRDISEHLAVLNQLQCNAERDSLTGCLNYAAWQQRLTSAIEQNEPFSVVIWDLERFRDVNDGRGELIGDHLLQNFARHLEHFKPEHSELARLHSDRFAWLVKTADPIELAQDCQTIKTQLEHALVNGISMAQVEYQPPESHRYIMTRLFDGLREEKAKKQTEKSYGKVRMT